jgi:hypothetical protein
MRPALSLLLSLLLLPACEPVKVALDDDAASDDTQPDPDNTDDTDDGDDTDPAGDDTDPGGDDSGEPAHTGDSGAPTTSPVSEVSWQVHDRVATVIEVDFTLDRDAEAWIAWTIDGEEAGASPPESLSAGEHRQVILGVPEETTLRFVIHTDEGGVALESAATEATTGSLPSDLVPPNLVDGDPSLAGDERWLLTSVEVGSYNFYGPYYPVILDRAGNIVWYREYEDNRLVFFPRVARDGGSLLVDSTTIYTFGGEQPRLYHLTLDMRQEDELPMSDDSLPYDLLPDGTLLYNENTSSSQIYLTARYPDGSTERIWDCKAWMSAIKNVGYWDCMPNTITWNEDTNTVIWSMFQTSTVVELDLKTGEVLRQLGALPGSYTFSPPDAGFNLQHFPNYTADGTLIVSTHGVSGGRSQWAREYTVDDSTRTLTQVWSYQNDLGYYAEYAGEAKRLETGNTLVGFGTDGGILEITADGQTAWGVRWPGKLVGQATLLDDLYALNRGW